MPMRDLTKPDCDIVKACLACIAEGDVILHNGEFEAIMGVTVPELLFIASAWPVVVEQHVAVQCAVGNGLNNLLGYPHGKDDLLPVPPQEIARVLALWRGRPITSYFDGMV